MRLIGLVALVLMLAACDAGPAVTPAVSSVEAAGPRTASDVAGRFRLDFEMPKTTFSDDEEIQGLATLSLIGPGDGKIGASGGGPLMFGVRELTGTREMGPAADASCGSFDIGDVTPITRGLTKSGGWSADDPNAAFYQAFFRDKTFRLPAGTWEVTAHAMFAEGADCGGPSHDLTAAIRIDVTPAP